MVVFCRSLLSLSIACLALEIYERSSFRTALVDELASHADMLGMNTSASLAFNDRKSAQDLLGALRLEHHIIGAFIYDTRGNIFAEYRRDDVGEKLIAPRLQSESTRFESQTLTVYRESAAG
jgi:hypothetical protein